MYLVNKWCDHACNIRLNKSRSPNFSDLVCFVQNAVDSASDPVFGRAVYQKQDEQKPSPPGAPQKQSVSLGTSIREKCCPICKSQHLLAECQIFIA